MTGRLVAVMLVAALSACTESTPLEPTEPEVVDIRGVWEGPVQEEYGGSGTLRMVITDGPAGFADAFAGTFEFSFEDPSRDRAGTMDGSYATTFLPSHMALIFTTDPCEFFPNGSGSHAIYNWVLDEGRLKANYMAHGCLGSSLITTGSFELARLE